MLNFLRKIRAFLWGGFPKIRCHRNDDEFIFMKRIKNPIFLERYGYKVYSQNDEDGIIAEIFNRIGTTNMKFVEFGVENGLESNTHFLLHQGWNGLWIDGNKKAINEIMLNFRKPLENKKLFVLNNFITVDNINRLIGLDGNLNGLIDLLSIDIDGNDYWIWKSITCISPRVVIIEYNAKFPPSYEWIMEYNEKHIWHGSDEQGASLKALEKLGEELGYYLVGTNKTGVNAFFVKKELVKNLFPNPATAENLYNPTRWDLKFISGHPSEKYIGK